MKQTYVLRHPGEFDMVRERVEELMKSGPVRVTVETHKKRRSLEQNSQSHVWYDQIAKELQEDTAEGVKCECKLRFGVPILRAESDEFREQYDRLIKRRFSYEEKLELMRFIPVTSLMTTDQLSRYLEQIQVHYAARGVQLEFSETASENSI